MGSFRTGKSNGAAGSEGNGAHTSYDPFGVPISEPQQRPVNPLTRGAVGILALASLAAVPLVLPNAAQQAASDAPHHWLASACQSIAICLGCFYASALKLTHRWVIWPVTVLQVSALIYILAKMLLAINGGPMPAH